MEPVTFTTEDGVHLEGELRIDVPETRGSAVICHPHPKHGGSKDHPVLWAIRNELAGACGFGVLTFNFRGVMGSSGSYGGGRDEIKDARAAVGFVRDRTRDAPTLIVGWSFGANIAVREALDDERVAALALIGIPLQPNDLDLPALPAPIEVRSMGRPVLFAAGTSDEYCPVELLADYADAAGSQITIVEGTDHYFWKRERELAAAIGEWVDGALRAQ